MAWHTNQIGCDRYIFLMLILISKSGCGIDVLLPSILPLLLPFVFGGVFCGMSISALVM